MLGAGRFRGVGLEERLDAFGLESSELGFGPWPCFSLSPQKVLLGSALNAQCRTISRCWARGET